ncbi:MAG TPA: hypothetical protein VFK68_11085 [Propionibacteriaceae bacterium]|nr:hypothetical protein [Propionibacteriaceae bacterium]
MSQNQGPGDGWNPPSPQPSPSQPYGEPSSQPYRQPYSSPAQQPYSSPTQQPYAYPSQQSPAQPYGYQPQPAPGYQVQPYGQQGLAPVGGYEQPRAEKRSSVLGALALLLVVVCGVVLSWSMWRVGGIVGPLIVNGSVDTSNQAELQQALMRQFGGLWAALVEGSVILGFAGWIMGIVAAATKRGTGLGVTAIVLGALAPFVAIGVLVAALAPYAS